MRPGRSAMARSEMAAASCESARARARGRGTRPPGTPGPTATWTGTPAGPGHPAPAPRRRGTPPRRRRCRTSRSDAAPRAAQVLHLAAVLAPQVLLRREWAHAPHELARQRFACFKPSLSLAGDTHGPSPPANGARGVARLFFVAELFGADVFLLARGSRPAEPRERESEPPFVGCLSRVPRRFFAFAPASENGPIQRANASLAPTRATSAASARGTESASGIRSKSDDVKPCAATFMNKIATNCSISSGRMICLIFCDSFCAPTPNRRRAWRKRGARRRHLACAFVCLSALPCLESSVNTNFLPVNAASHRGARLHQTVEHGRPTVRGGRRRCLPPRAPARAGRERAVRARPSPECSGASSGRQASSWPVVRRRGRCARTLARGTPACCKARTDLRSAAWEKDADGSRSVALEYRKTGRRSLPPRGPCAVRDRSSLRRDLGASRGRRRGDARRARAGGTRPGS